MPTAPTFTDVVNQQFFIESQGGSQHPISYLDRFPDTVYSKAIDSVLVTFLYALLGPVGVGQLRQEYLEARLQFEEAGLNAGDLDALYTNPFAFARLAEETYQMDASAALLPAAEQADIIAKDASFRNRAILFFKGIRAGGTRLGMSLVAQSGLNHAADLIENYRYLYDRYADWPLGLDYYGSTGSLNEVIILPRQEIPQSAVQTVSFNGNPTQGYFTISLSLGGNYTVARVGTTLGSNVITVPNAAAIPPGTYVSITAASGSSITGATPVMYAMAGAPLSPTTIQLVYPTGAAFGLPYNVPASPGTGSFLAYIGNAQTYPLPYNATSAAITAALVSLPVVDGNNVSVSGGPLPANPVTISFTNALADQPIPPVVINLSQDPITGIGAVGSAVGQVADIVNNPLTITPEVTTTTIGTGSDDQNVVLSAANEHAMMVALDEIRPQTCFITTVPAQSTTMRQPVNTTFAGSQFTQVVRYETGNHHVTWPALDNTHWIEVAVEHEAPNLFGNQRQNYQGFHNVVGVQAYTEEALTDSGYGAGTANPAVKYYDTMLGVYSQAQVALYPFLAKYQNSTSQAFNVPNAIASQPEPLVITTQNNVSVINNHYPRDYTSLPGVPPFKTSPVTFWSSQERAQGVDYLEIDLGTVQAVNYLSFEATRKPYIIDVAYDSLDQSPARHFVSVTLVPTTVVSSITNLTYSASATNPWEAVQISFTNSLGQMIYTRFIRIGFTKNPGSTPFNPAPGQLLPYSIEVRNLRVGRNLPVMLSRTVTA